MADRSILVKLGMDISDYVSKVGQARKATDSLGDGAEEAAKKSKKGLSGLADSARENRAEWTTAGSALAVFGGAITAAGVAALKTGISYNTLQQTTRASLKTLTGSAEAANAQMDKLDEFARTSPFAKQVFISAQQQMLGFGIEAAKVVPYLDSIQNAVAAAGGSNSDIAELSEIFAKISATSKITATDLMQFGTRGVDAATLIGSQMNMTGAQIREEITAGTLDAEAALDALAAGMQATYGGAAANVKETFEGAFDRVKGAWRDFASELAEPLVGKHGGGALVGILNWAADVMRAFEKLPGPVKTATTTLTGLVGVSAAAGGSFLLLAPRVVDTMDAFRKLAPAGSKARGVLGGIGKAAGAALVIGAVATATIALADALGPKGIAADGDRALAALKGIGDLNLDTLFLDATAGAYDMNDAMERLATAGRDTRWGMRMADSLGVTTNASLNAQKTFEELDATITAFVKAGELDTAAQLLELYAGNLDESRFSTEDLMALLPGYESALAAAAAESELAADGADGMADSTRNATDAVEDQVDALWDLTSAYQGLGQSVLDAREAERRYQETLDKATDSIKDNGKTLDINTEKGRNNESALDAIATAGWNLIEQQREQGASNSELRGSMASVREDFIETAQQMGLNETQAKDLANQLGLIPSNISTDVALTGVDEATRKLRGFSDQVYNLAGKSIRIPVSTSLPTGGLGMGYYGGSYATGGPIHGPGTETSDSIGIRVSRNEHIISAAEVRGAGGHSAIAAMRSEWRAGRSGLGFANGGTPAARFITPRPMVTVNNQTSGTGMGDLDRKLEQFADRFAYQMAISSTGAGVAAAGTAKAYTDSSADSQVVLRR